MPIKKRIDKGRHLDAYRREMLLNGHEAMLLAGCGYLGEVMASHFATATPEQRAAILAAMWADWARHRDWLLAEGGDWWAERELTGIQRGRSLTCDFDMSRPPKQNV